MRKILICVLLIVLAFPSTLPAYSRACPTEFIYKAGDLSTKRSIIFLKNYIKNIDIEGLPIKIKIKSNLSFIYKNNRQEPLQSFSPDRTLLAETKEPTKNKVSVSILKDSKSGRLSWEISGVSRKISFKSRVPFTREEYKLVAEEEEIYAKPGGNGIIIQYAGPDPDNSDLVFYLTNAAALPKFSVKKVRLHDLPGYFRFLGGIIQIREANAAGKDGSIEYQWEKKPHSVSGV